MGWLAVEKVPGGDAAEIMEARPCCWKHSRQRTGRPWVGLKGTMVSTAQAEQVVRVSVRRRPAVVGLLPGAPGGVAR